ncbi:hypothetical protein BDA99DRAFT_542605 [Phascolomyces articulosus]|uniref:Uncharacterized protein n=1 Tax=Phascolomyces articulosus TaxID=60185 RepID=A0AAD5K2J9_9FUNG|nr:hypothetical protein BDA99DRAFT_542605 [Phascolomyces articulosus]
MVPDMVYILPLNRRLSLTVKDTVFHPKVIVEFAQEIEQMYNNNDINASIHFNTNTAVIEDLSDPFNLIHVPIVMNDLYLTKRHITQLLNAVMWRWHKCQYIYQSHTDIKMPSVAFYNIAKLPYYIEKLPSALEQFLMLRDGDKLLDAPTVFIITNNVEHYILLHSLFVTDLKRVRT